MFCSNCGAEILPNANYCQGCGKLIEGLKGQQHQSVPVPDPKPESVAPTVREVVPRPTFNKTRKLNWAVAAILAAGVALMLFKAPASTGLVTILLIGIIVVGFPILTAVALGHEDFSLLGVYISIDDPRRSKVQRVSLVLNWIVGALGIMGVLACIGTGQFGPLVPMLIYVMLPFLNIRALRELSRFEAGAA